MSPSGCLCTAVLGVLALYIACHVIAAVLGLPAGVVVGLMVQAVGFGGASALALGLLYQVWRGR